MSTDISDADNLELQALKALVRDNIKDENGNNISLPNISGGGTDLDYDFHTVNMINQDIFSSQVHVVHTTHEIRPNDQDALFLDVSCGSVSLQPIEIDESTSAYIEANLVLDVSNGVDEIPMIGQDQLNTVNKHKVIFTSATDEDKAFTKALLSAEENQFGDVFGGNDILLQVREDPNNIIQGQLLNQNNLSNAFSAVGATKYLNIAFDASSTALPQEVLTGTYRIKYDKDGNSIVTIGGVTNPPQSAAQTLPIRDLSGNVNRVVFSGADGLSTFLPGGASNANNFSLQIALAQGGNIEVTDPAFDVLNFENMVNNLDYMNAVREFGNNKNTLNDLSVNYLTHIDVSSHNIIISNSVTDLSFGGTTNSSYDNSGGSFTTTLDSTQDEFLSSVLQGEIKLKAYPANERLNINNNADVSNVILATNVGYNGELSTTTDGSFVLPLLNSSEVVNYNVKQIFPNPGSTLLDSECINNGNKSNGLVVKDVSSNLFTNADVTATFNDANVATIQAQNDITILKVTDNNVFAARTDKIFDLVNTDNSFGNPDFQISVTGTNVDLDIAGVYNFDQVRLFLEPKTIADLSNNGAGLVDTAGNLEFSTSDAAGHLKTKVDYSRSMNDFTWDVLDNNSIDLSFDVVSNIETDISAHEFQSKAQTLIKRQWTLPNGTVKTDIDYPEDYTLSNVSSNVTTVDSTGDSSLPSNIKRKVRTTTCSITVPFYLSAYKNLQVKYDGITIKDTFYEYFHSDGTQGPESKLRGFSQPASREVTFTPQSRTFTKSMMHTMTGQLQGRNKAGAPNAGNFDTSEDKVDIDVAFNESTQITKFNTSQNAIFNIDLDLDEGTVSLDSSQYAINLDFAEGNSTWTVERRSGNTLEDLTNGINSLQDILSASNMVNDVTFTTQHTVANNGTNTLGLLFNGNEFMNLQASRTLLANFGIVISNGPILQVTRSPTDISFDKYIYTNTDKLLLEQGVEITLDENKVNFNGTDASLSLKKDRVSVNHTGNAGVESDIISNKLYEDVSAQNVSFNNYRGIVQDQTIQIRRVGGNFQLDFSNNTQTLQGDLLAGTEIDASFADFADVSMGDLGYDIKSNKSHFGTANPISSSPSTHLTLTPAQYNIIGSPEFIINDATKSAGIKTSFSEVLFDFHQESQTQSTGRVDGVWISSKIASSSDNAKYVLETTGTNTYQVFDPSSDIITPTGGASGQLDNLQTLKTEYFNHPVNHGNKYPFKVELTGPLDNNIDATFTIDIPKFEVKYRDPTGVNSFPVTSNSVITELFSSGTSVHSLRDISVNIELDVSKTYIDYTGINSSHDVIAYKTNMVGYSNLVKVGLFYDPSINPSFIDEPDLLDFNIIDSITKVGNFFNLSLRQQASGLYTSYDVCNNLLSSDAAKNILIKLPSSFMNPGQYSTTITPNVGVRTSIIGAEYDLSGSGSNGVPVIKIRKYTSHLHESLDTFKIDKNNVRAVAFKAAKIHEATIQLESAVFGNTVYSFQNVLNDTANNLNTLPNYTELQLIDASNENIWATDYTTGLMKYVMVPLTFSGVGNILEVTGANTTKPVKTLVASTPDITRVTSADGSPLFRLRANGRVDTGTLQTQTFVSVTKQTNNSGVLLNNEFVSYNVLLG